MKKKYYYDRSGLHIVKKELMARDFNLIFDGYHNSTFDNKKITTTITFFENELYEDIILNSSLNPVVEFENKKNVYKGILMVGMSAIHIMKKN